MINSTDSEGESRIYINKCLNESARSELSDTIPLHSELESAEPHSSHQVPKKSKKRKERQGTRTPSQRTKEKSGKGTKSGKKLPSTCTSKS